MPLFRVAPTVYRPRRLRYYYLPVFRHVAVNPLTFNERTVTFNGKTLTFAR